MNETANRAKKELEQYGSILRQMKYAQDRMVQIRSQVEATSKPPREIDIQRTADPKSIEMLLCELADLFEMYAEIGRTAAQFCRMIEKRIGSVPSIPGLILRMRFIEGKCLIDVALDLDYSIRQTIRLQNKGLDEYAKLMRSES